MVAKTIFIYALLSLAIVAQSNTCPSFFGGDLLQTGMPFITQENTHLCVKEDLQITSTSLPSISISLILELRSLQVIMP